MVVLKDENEKIEKHEKKKPLMSCAYIHSLWQKQKKK
jgi:hypothetical protein